MYPPQAMDRAMSRQEDSSGVFSRFQVVRGEERRKISDDRIQPLEDLVGLVKKNQCGRYIRTTTTAKDRATLRADQRRS